MIKPRALFTSAFLFATVTAFAQDASATAAATPAAPAWAIDKGDTAWMAIATALVLLMTPGLALFYGGMVRRKNVLSTYLHSFIMLGIVSILWVLIGYSIAFGKGSTAYFGGFEFLGGAGIDIDKPYPYFTGALQHTFPHALFMLFQMMFAVITPALISGAIAERMKFSSYVLFTSLWSLLVYAPIAYWVWNPGGWLFARGALDFAGGTVVHLASGVSALVACIVVGRRRALDHQEPILPNNLTTTLLGAGLLWFGWIGFNAGSAVAANGVMVNAFATTHLAAAAGMLGWLICEKFTVGKPTALGAASGLVAGLVAITPGAGFLPMVPAIIVGFAIGAICCFAVGLKHKLKYDDSLDVVGVHGVGGLLGAIATGVFASESVNSVVADSLKANGGRMGLILTQVIGVVAVALFAAAGTFIILKIVQAVTGGVRVTEEEEQTGLDLALHGESGYNL